MKSRDEKKIEFVLVFGDFLMVFGFSASWGYEIPNLCVNLPQKLFFVPGGEKKNRKKIGRTSLPPTRDW